jgi:hypothetical protein
MDTSKTIPLQASVETYLSQIEDDQKQADCGELIRHMQSITHEEPVMWGSSIIGFGSRHYTYETGREGDTMVIGLSARKQAITLYGLVYYDKNSEFIPRLGKCKVGKGCLYIKRLSDIDTKVLQQMIHAAWKNQS